MNNYIIGTAGHIDHGKTSLIKAITGVNTDTLKEEQERGITVNLGFTYMNLTPEHKIGIIDVPGHEKLIKNMLSGVCGIDLVLLVVAANDGIMPQTKEHVDILNFLNIKNVLVVITKTDLVDTNRVQEVKSEIKNKFGYNSFTEFNIKDSSLASSVKEEIKSKLTDINYEIGNEPFRMTIDRAFNVKGHGVVITGSSLSGEVSIGDSLELLPSNQIVKVKGIQAFNEAREKAYKRMRVAINISGVKLDEVSRGMIIAGLNTVKETKIIDVKLRTSDNLSKDIKNLEELKLYYLASELNCRIKLIDKKTVSKNEEVYCQLLLNEEIYCNSGDVGILRKINPVETIAGFEIINVLGKHTSRKDTTYVETVKQYDSDDKTSILINYVTNNPFLKKQEILDSLDIDKIDDTDLIIIDRHYITSSYDLELKNKIRTTITNFHKDNPYKEGIDKNELLSLLNLESSKLKILTKYLKSLDLYDVSSTVRTKGYKIPLSQEDEKTKNSILNYLDSFEFSPCSFEELLEEFAENTDLIYALIKRKDLIKIDKSIVISTNIYDKIKVGVHNFFASNEVLTISDMRELFNISRKYVVSYLEHFDEIALTKRVEGGRVKR